MPDSEQPEINEGVAKQSALHPLRQEMKVYHRTQSHIAHKILKEGFRDGIGTYLTDRRWKGVWVSNIPLTPNEGAIGDVVLLLEIPGKIFKEYEWIEEGKPYREALIPAKILNQFGQPRIDRSEWK